MSRWLKVCAMVCALVLVAGSSRLRAQPHRATLAVVMTNETTDNKIKVYDAETGALLQTLSTRGQGGVGGNARGVRQLDGDIVAAVNNGSNTVAIFRRFGNALRFDRLVSTSSAPVSVDFGNDHMYVAGTQSVDSFVLLHRIVAWQDGTAWLQLVGGAVPPAGSTAQVGVVDDSHLIVTLKTDPDPGTVDIVALHKGRVTGALPTAVSAPAGTLTPFGFSVYPDGTAIITLAHSNQDGLFRNGAFTTVAAAGQSAPCWTTRVGKYVFTANTGSQTISRLVGTGTNIFVDDPTAATIPTGGPTDIDAERGLLGVVDHGGGVSHLSLFRLNAFGELTAVAGGIDLGAPAANGVAIVPPRDLDSPFWN